jgi:hypothetical protein
MERALAKLFENITLSGSTASEFYSEFRLAGTNIEKVKLVSKFFQWEPPSIAQGTAFLILFLCLTRSQFPPFFLVSVSIRHRSICSSYFLC